MNNTIFFSWQSDSPSSTNLIFIQSALEKAVDAILEQDLSLDLAVDRDTKGIPGTPSVADTILMKIEQALILVADVSIINPQDRDVPGRRLTSNPNVLLELGFAAGKLGWERIILVHNLAYGAIEELPFDLRSRRPVAYRASLDDRDLSQKQRALQRDLQAAISSSIQAQQRREPDIRIFFKPSPGRFGVKNNGSSPITVSRFIYEFPQTINVNSSGPSDHPPILQASNGGNREGVQYWKMTLIRTNSGPVPGYLLNWTLPDYIAPGESELFQDPPAYIRENPPPDAKITLKLYLSDGTVITKTPTMQELFDPVGPYAPE